MILKWWCPRLPSGYGFGLNRAYMPTAITMYFKLHEFKRIKKGIIDL